MTLKHRLPPKIAQWPERWRYEYEERAGILEYEAALPRAEAESRAEQMVREECDRQTRLEVLGNVQPMRRANNL